MYGLPDKTTPGWLSAGLKGFLFNGFLVGTGLALFWLLYRFSGGPLYWDDLMYLELAVNPTESPNLVQRYFHILLLRLSYLATGDALTAARLLWAASYVGTVIAVYCGAYLLASANRKLIGVLAVAIYVGTTGLWMEAGVPLADYTLTMLAASTVTAYLAWCRFRETAWVNVVLGSMAVGLFVLASFSKETALVLAPLILIVAYYLFRDAFTSRPVILMVVLALTVASGILIVVMGGVVDPRETSLLEILRRSDFQIGRLGALFARAGEVELGSKSYLESVMRYHGFLFLAFLMGGYRWREQSGQSLLAASWFVPFSLLLFLNVVVMTTNWGIKVRYLYPAFPVMAMWAAQMFQPPGSMTEVTAREARNRRHLDRVSWYGWPALGVLLLAFLWWAPGPILRFLVETSWERIEIEKAIVDPLALMMIFSIAFMVRKWTPGVVALLVVSTTMFLAPKIDREIWLLRSGVVAAKTEARFRWLEPIGTVMELREDSRIFLSGDLYEKHRIGGRHFWASRQMINVYHNFALDEEGIVQADDLSPLRYQPFDIVLITRGEWRAPENGWLEHRFENVTPPSAQSVVVYLRPRDHRNSR